MVLYCWILSSKTLTLQLPGVTLPTIDHIWWEKVFVKIQLEFFLLQLESVACSAILPLVLLLCTFKQVSLPALLTTIGLLKTAIRSPLRSLFSSSCGWTSPVSQTCLTRVRASAAVIPCHWYLLVVLFQFASACLLPEVPKLDIVLHMWSNECQTEGKEGEII